MRMRPSTNIESLPEELLYDILLELPAEDIYKGARLVCKKWYKMICNPKFVYAHFHNSTPGLIVECRFDSTRPVTFVATRRGRIEVSKFNFEFRGVVWGSCNGLIVETVYDGISTHYITNPATDQRFDLPREEPDDSYSVMLFCYGGCADDIFSKKYKAVSMCCSTYNGSKIWSCAVLTVGVDKSWRNLLTEHLSVSEPLTTEGFVHWPHNEGEGAYVFTLNVETEIFTVTPVPQGCGGERLTYYLPTGKSLSLIVFCNDFSFEVWDMKPETGEWTTVFWIDLEARKCKFEHLMSKSCHSSLIPVGWLNYPEALAFRISASRGWFLYNVRTQEIDLFELDRDSSCYNYGAHRNSLLWLKY
ncbi:hypothetical protein ABFS82_01G057500 [Erythranthe guttata]|uniref:putative F-box only protein 15 n=1 Tax=Erythranthe guttata TaxID=4155 RepID=UPI00064DF5B9|nr:PREDICTED: putative F-box only protein 15 [Erythranthe guttata]|eukprot:XP_012854098.1 PREDICTED: putative F-box only protein 15 [Erythranthe guttata]